MSKSKLFLIGTILLFLLKQRYQFIGVMKFGCAFFLVLLLTGCGNKKKSSDEGSVMDVKDFYEMFRPVKLPYTVSDTSFNKLSRDTPVINVDLLYQFIGDTVVTKLFGTSKPKIYPSARVNAKKAETYLFAKAITSTRKVAYLFVFDKENKFKASLPLVVSDNDPQTTQSASMDSRYTISLNRQRKKSNGELGYRKDAYVYNNIGVFTLILTESNDDLATIREVINPLDTLPRKNKLSADYVLDKRNFVSVRDGRKGSSLRFFVHFEKSKGTCRGELRGEATIAKPNIAIYRESGDPCVLEFTFETNSVTMKEIEGCGNYRDIKCFFEGTYPRKKESRKLSGPKASKKK